MKTHLLAVLLLTSTVFIALAQTPQGINYQAVVRQANGDVVNNQTVSLRISILAALPPAVYVETHAPTTNSFGLVNVVIGNGAATQGAFSTINWGNSPYFIQLEIDVLGGSNYAMMGTQQLMSVPYALYAETSGQPGTPGATGPTGADGTNGAVGATGAAGSQGIQGVAGNDGVDGADGTDGATGPTGLQGIQGVAGNNGVDGTDGATGPTGTQGIQGVAGNNGTDGTDGATGPTGLQGIQGVTGNNGIDGTDGATGATGLQGIQGVTGNNGTGGTDGATGPTGLQGIQGIAGNNGSDGTDGTDGATGPTGLQGIQGIDGATGATGAQGIQGVAGADGTNGIDGLDGATGATGAQGIQGVAGADGTNGTDGLDGATGATGAQGIQGVAGADGTNGTDGLDGATGLTGATGPAGNGFNNGTALNQILFWNGSAWITLSPGANAQVLTLCSNTLTWTTGGVCPGTITTITCGSATNSGTLTSGIAASGVSSSVPYTAGNGGAHSGQTVSSTGVTGLTATLVAGSFANGAGSLIYTITGTPSAAGTASFALNIGGQGCTLTLTVVAAPTYPAGSVFCAYGASAIVNVTNPTTGKIWMDRNLGATQVATSSTDEDSYGDLYQWGRRTDRHQCRASPTTATLSAVDQPAHGNFIIINSGNYDWRSPQNVNLWQGVSGVNNPCPSGYRLPTDTELEDERVSWGASNAAGAFASPLKLPMSGYRYFSNGSLYQVGTNGNYWSSTVSGTNSRHLQFYSSGAFITTNDRAHGFSVRCLKD